MGFVNNLLMIVLLFTALFLIVLILIQRGKGGGLAGAFGGMGGQSAFGTKAGDMFTKITIGVASFWIILCIIMVKLSGVSSGPLSQDMGGKEAAPGVSASAPADQKPAGDEKASDKAEAPAGDKAEAPASDKAEAPAGDKAEAPAGDKAEAPAGDKAEAPAETPAKDESK